MYNQFLTCNWKRLGIFYQNHFGHSLFPHLTSTGRLAPTPTPPLPPSLLNVHLEFHYPTRVGNSYMHLPVNKRSQCKMYKLLIFASCWEQKSKDHNYTPFFNWSCFKNCHEHRSTHGVKVMKLLLSKNAPHYNPLPYHLPPECPVDVKQEKSEC